MSKPKEGDEYFICATSDATVNAHIGHIAAIAEFGSVTGACLVQCSCGGTFWIPLALHIPMGDTDANKLEPIR